MATNNTSVFNTDFNSITDFINKLVAVGATLKPVYLKDKVTKTLILDNAGNKQLRGFAAVNIDDKIDLTDELVKSIEVSVKEHKPHFNVFTPDDKNEDNVLFFGKFNNMALEDVCSNAEDM